MSLEKLPPQTRVEIEQQLQQFQVSAPYNRPIVNCDREAWIKERINTAIEMAFGIRRAHKVQADDPALKSGIEGIVNGVSIEIIHLLGMEPEYKNLRRV